MKVPRTLKTNTEVQKNQEAQKIETIKKRRRSKQSRSTEDQNNLENQTNTNKKNKGPTKPGVGHRDCKIPDYILHQYPCNNFILPGDYRYKTEPDICI